MTRGPCALPWPQPRSAYLPCLPQARLPSCLSSKSFFGDLGLWLYRIQDSETQIQVFPPTQARRVLFHGVACLWKAVSCWPVEKNGSPAHRTPLLVWTQLCCIQELGVTPQFPRYWHHGRGVLVVAGDFFFFFHHPGQGMSWFCCGWEQAASPRLEMESRRERPGQGRSWPDLKIRSNKREEAGLLARNRASTHPLVKVLLWVPGLREPGQWLLQHSLNRGMEAASALPPGLEHP